MGCNCNIASKILFIIGSIFGVVAVILFIVGSGAFAASTTIGFELEDATSGSIVADADSAGCGLGCTIYARATLREDCDSITAGIIVQFDGNPVSVNSRCWSITQSQWELDNDPPLFTVASFSQSGSSVDTFGNPIDTRATGTFTIQSTITPVWVVDSGEELGEALAGAVGLILFYYVGVIIAIVGSILCCVGCCCMCNNDQSAPPPQQGVANVVVGRPT